MEIFNLILILILTGFTLNGLFNEKWRKEIQYRIDCIKHKNTFWDLMSRNDVELTILDIYRLYVINLKRELCIGDLIAGEEKISDQHNLSKKVIKKGNNSHKNIEAINHEIEKNEKSIKKLIEKYNFIIKKAEFHKKFKEHKNEYLFGEDRIYDNLTSYFIGLMKSENSGASIWDKRKIFEDKIHDFEYKPGGNEYIDLLESLKISQIDIGKIFTNLVCEKITDKTSAKKLRILISEWEQLHMLRWCIADYTAWTIGTNGIQRTIWRFIVSIFL